MIRLMTWLPMRTSGMIKNAKIKLFAFLGFVVCHVVQSQWSFFIGVTRSNRDVRSPVVAWISISTASAVSGRT